MYTKDYVKKASRTLLLTPDFQLTPQEVMLSWNVHGLCGEIAEVVELSLIGFALPYPNDRKKLPYARFATQDMWKKEIGDVFWYMAAISSGFGWEMLPIPNWSPTKPKEKKKSVELIVSELTRYGGKVQERCKKEIYHRKGIKSDKWHTELQAVFSSLLDLCEVLSLDWLDVLDANIKKLEERFPNGFDNDRTSYEG